jgi:hypothetical protein
MPYLVLALLAVQTFQLAVYAAPAAKAHAAGAEGHATNANGHTTGANGHAASANGHATSANEHATSANGHAASAKPLREPAAGSATDSANKVEIDSANDADTVKSWTSENPPTEQDRNFLKSLNWKDHKAGSYVIKTGIIFDKWIAAMQFTVNGKAVLTEYTPPSEYLIFVDPKTGTKSSKLLAADVNEDGALEVAFLHEKLNDPNYHMYSVYSLNESAPKLVWKSGGKFGDWLTQAHRHGGTLWKGGASPE